MKNSSAEISDQNIEILDFEKKHADAVLQIQAGTGLSVWTKNDYLGELERNDSVFKIARAGDEKIIGFALVRLLIGNSDDSSVAFDSSEILNIAVCRSVRQKGVGQRIFDEILRSLKEKNIKETWLEVRASNAKAIAFYRKNGFEMQFERKNYYQNPPENAGVYRRLIDF